MIQIDERTSKTLLSAIRVTQDNDSWVRFVKTYEPLLTNWLRARGVPDFVIPDVLSEVYVKLIDHLSVFIYDSSKSFRGWLRTVAENAAADMKKRAWNRYEHSVDFSRFERNQSVCRQSDPRQDEMLDAFLDQAERRLRLANIIVDRVKARVSAKTWEAFYLTEIEEKSCADAALKLNMKEGSVYVARFRVRNSLQKEGEKFAAESADEASGALV